MRGKLVLFVFLLILLSLSLYLLFPPPWLVVEWRGVKYAFNVDSPEFARGVIEFPGPAFF